VQVTGQVTGQVKLFTTHNRIPFNEKFRQCLKNHPHVCEEYAGVQVPRPFHDGSPPHTWGILFTAAVWRYVKRFIPTYVGEYSNLIPNDFKELTRSEKTTE
jgi:hypothetical protein